MRAVILYAAVLLLGGCDGTAGVDEHSISGARLRAKHIVSDDGAREFDGWWDSMLEVDCAFSEKLSPKTLRCLPFITELSQSGKYIDDSCTLGAFAFFGAKYGRLDSGPVQEAATRSQTVFIPNGSACVPIENTDGLTGLGPVVDVDAFEPAVVEID